jgi:hypothetical protein
MGSKWDQTGRGAKLAHKFTTPKQNGKIANVSLPGKPLTDTEDSEAYEDEALYEDSGQCHLVWNHT